MVQNDKKFRPNLHISGTIHQAIISPGCFFYFFRILIFWVVRGFKVEKSFKMTKNSVRHAPYLSHLCFQNCNIFRYFFHFFENFDFLGPYWEGGWGGRGWGGAVKVQELIQNDKKLCLSSSISQELSQEPYIIIHHMIVIYGSNV